MKLRKVFTMKNPRVKYNVNFLKNKITKEQLSTLFVCMIFYQEFFHMCYLSCLLFGSTDLQYCSSSIWNLFDSVMLNCSFVIIAAELGKKRQQLKQNTTKLTRKLDRV
jgi:general stress protein CsbA